MTILCLGALFKLVHLAAGATPHSATGLCSKSYHNENSQVKTSETASTRRVNQIHYQIPWKGVTKTSTSIKYRKNVAMVAPIISSLSLILSLASLKSRRILENYCRLSQCQPRCILIVATTPGIVLLIEQINTKSGIQ